ncbi:hypothetical protein [Kitasatospora phosalacinea]|uniref:Uncharacterized protein n=1 Tax=Kitasatospora phosalacinea TaxID=2065 RepID=A0ABW6GRF6_9ACTN
MDIPDDLVDLQRARLDAELAYAEYVHAVEARRRAEHPTDIVARRCWTPEEQAEADRLQGELAAAMDAIRLHPALTPGPGRHKLEQGALRAAKELVAAG